MYKIFGAELVENRSLIAYFLLFLIWNFWDFKSFLLYLTEAHTYLNFPEIRKCVFNRLQNIRIDYVFITIITI